MSRLESIIKGGFYPLLEEWQPYLTNLFKPSKSEGRILDPFAGEGVAVEYLGNSLNLLPYAVENDLERGAVIQQKFGPVRGVIDDCYGMQMSNNSFPFIYLNPPYMPDEFSDSRRAEYKALQHHWKYLQLEGLMIWVVYAQQLTKAAARSFFNNCSRVDIYRFPELHMNTYTQICVVGRKRDRYSDRTGFSDFQIDEAIERFAALAQTPEKIRDIRKGVRVPKGAPEGFDPRYDIPPAKYVKFFNFVPQRPDPKALLKLCVEYGAQNLPNIREVVQLPQELPRITPVAKPRNGQLAVVIASGMIDGIEVEHEGKRCLLRGSVKRVTIQVKEEHDEDNKGNKTGREVYHDIPQSQIVILADNGEVFNISDDDKLVAFIQQHRAELMDYFEKVYKPAYDMLIDPLWAETYDTLKIKGDKDMLPTQEYVATAATEHLLREPSLIIVGEPSVGKTAIAIAVNANMVKAERMKLHNVASLDSIGQRYNLDPRKLRGLKPGEVTIVLCPANMPSKWKREINDMYPEAIAEILTNVLEVRAFFDAAETSERPHIGIITFERAKLAETWGGACMIRNKRGKIPVVDEQTKEQRTQIVTKPLVMCPTTGELMMVNVRGAKVHVAADSLKARKYFYEGAVFNGHQWRPSQDGKNELHKDYRVATDQQGLAMWQDERMYGLPKSGNGRVMFDEEDIEIHEGRHSVVHRKITENLWPDEPILDEWIAQKGVRVYESSSKRSHIDKRLREKKLKAYRVGDGDRELDKMLKGLSISTYYAGEGRRVPRNPRYPLAQFIARKYKGRIGLVVVDELHKSKGIDTDIGFAARTLCMVANKALGLTGTLYGGVASSIYAIEFVFNRRVREGFPWVRSSKPMHWMETMGVLEDVYESKAEYKNGHFAGYKRYQSVQSKEVPGCSPLLVRELLDHTLFVGLKDLGKAMPLFFEKPEEVEMDAGMAANYDHVYEFLKQYNAECIKAGDGSFTGAFYQGCLGLPDSMHRVNEVYHNTAIDKNDKSKGYTNKHVLTIQPIGDYVKPKEEMLADRLTKVIERGDRAIVFLNQSATRDIRDRIMNEVIIPNVPGAKPFILHTSVDADERMDYIENRVESGHNILICNPKLVAEGVDLIWFNHTFYIEINSSLHIMGQSSRRTWRLNQTSEEVFVYYLYYDDVFQNAAVYSIAEKTQAANVLYGNEGGSLSSLSESANIFETIAKVVKEGMKVSRDVMAAKFNSAAYDDADFLESSWYAEPRAKQIIERPVFVEPVVEEQSVEDFVQDLDLFGNW
jgi:hypothetical protein